MMPGSAIIVDIRWRWWRSPNPSLRLNLNLSPSPNLSLSLNNQSLSILVNRLLEPLLSLVKWCFHHGRIPIPNHSPNLSPNPSLNPSLRLRGLSMDLNRVSRNINSPAINRRIISSHNISLSLKKRKRTVAVSLWR